jgi:hypothetical protein
MLLGMKAIAQAENVFNFCLHDSYAARKKIGIEILLKFGIENYKLTESDGSISAKMSIEEIQFDMSEEKKDLEEESDS